MNDEKLLSLLRKQLAPHTEAIRNESGSEHDILPSLFSALLESQLALASASTQSTEATKQQSEALLHELKNSSELTAQQTQSIVTSLTHAVEEIKQQITSANSTTLQYIEKVNQQNETLEKKTKIIVYSLAAALILLSIITLKLFIR